MYKQIALAVVLMTGNATAQPAKMSRAGKTFEVGTEAAKAIERLSHLSAATRERRQKMREPIYLPGPVLALGLSTTIAAQTIKTTETERALARLGDLAPDAVSRRLSELRPPANQAGPVLLNEIIKQLNLTVMAGERVERLKTALQPVLAYHKRDGKLTIFVVRSDQPRAYVAVHAALIITTKLMVITSEAELRGIIAHELAHQYLWDERERAFKDEDKCSLREIELFCDAVAAFTLKAIGDDPACYARALERMTNVGIMTRSITRHETNTHPSLDERMKLNKWLCQRLDQHVADLSVGTF